MNARDSASLACKVFSIFLIIQALAFIPGLIASPLMMRQGTMADYVAATYLRQFALTLALGILLWLISGWLATKMVPHEKGGAGTLHISVPELMTIAFSIVGLIILYRTIPLLAAYPAFYLTRTEVQLQDNNGLIGLLDKFTGGVRINPIDQIGRHVTGLAIGLLLVLIPSRLVRLVYKPE